ncbi:MAG: YkgJ family cysteine cluster protein [Phycisphaeraceae bacterium]|nr:YkgJ family cysteine cluster protein [Phycisphaeraceae bacterium]
MQRTCCQTAEILVTLGDIARIEAHSSRVGFWERRRPKDPQYLEPDEDDPNWLRYTTESDLSRRLLKRLPGGDCTFLGTRGCELPEHVRPLVCRLYPFEYTESELIGVEDGYCPRDLFIPQDRPGVTMLTVLGMDPRHGERWRAQLYAELREEHHANRHDLRPA